MEALNNWLREDDTEFLTSLVQNRMFKMHTRCGLFHTASDFLPPIAEEVCANYFMNMDIYSRTSYIPQSDLSASFESLEEVKDTKS